MNPTPKDSSLDSANRDPAYRPLSNMPLISLLRLKCGDMVHFLYAGFDENNRPARFFVMPMPPVALPFEINVDALDYI